MLSLAGDVFPDKTVKSFIPTGRDTLKLRGSFSHQSWILTLKFTNCVTLGKSPTCFLPQLPHLWNGHNNDANMSIVTTINNTSLDYYEGYKINICFHLGQHQAHCKQHLNICSLYRRPYRQYAWNPVFALLTQPCVCRGVPFPDWHRGTGWTSSSPACGGDEFVLIHLHFFALFLFCSSRNICETDTLESFIRLVMKCPQSPVMFLTCTALS